MHDRCPVCDLKFDREPGYFLGAMYVSYALGVAIVALFAALLWSVTGWWTTKDIIWAVVLFLPLAPTITLFARVLWIYLDPDRSTPNDNPRACPTCRPSFNIYGPTYNPLARLRVLKLIHGY